MRCDAGAVPDSSPEAVAVHRALPFAAWCHEFLPDWFKRPDAPFHAEADARANECGIPIADCWGAGLGKTTRYVIARIVYVICEPHFLTTDEGTGRKRFAPEWEIRAAEALRIAECGVRIEIPSPKSEIRNEVRWAHLCIAAKTVDAACEKLDIVRHILNENEKIVGEYRDAVRPPRGADSRDDFVANGVRVFAASTGQSIRGKVHNGVRVQLFVGDDLEDEQIARSPRREKSLSQWLDSDVYPRLEEDGAGAVMQILLNMYQGRNCQALRYAALAEKVDPQGRPYALYRCYPRIGANGESVWPDRYTTRDTLRAMFIVGPSAARTQYHCKQSSDDTRFRPEWFQPYRLALIAPAALGQYKKILWLDPSFTAKETSDYKAIVVLGRARREVEVYCLHAWIRHCTAETAAQEIVRAWLQYPDVQVWIEGNAGAEDTYRALFRSLAKDGCTVPYVHYESTTSNKEIDITQWEGELSQGLCYFDVTECDQALLTTQFLDWPTGNDDGPDAWAKARKKLGLAELGQSPDIELRTPRGDMGVLMGVRRSVPPVPGSAEDNWQRRHAGPSAPAIY